MRKGCKMIRFSKYIILSLLVISTYAHANEVVSGIARVKDGDTIQINQTSIRLFGIDAPEKKQSCYPDWSLESSAYMCGETSTKALNEMVMNKIVTCTQKPGKDKYNRLLAVCITSDGKDLGEEMVRSGNAVAYKKYSLDYKKVEDDARNNNKGIWSGRFVNPWDWRKR